MGLPIGNTRAKIYSTSVIEITFLLFAYCYFYIYTFIYQASPTKKTKKQNKSNKTPQKRQTLKRQKPTQFQ